MLRRAVSRQSSEGSWQTHSTSEASPKGSCLDLPSLLPRDLGTENRKSQARSTSSRQYLSLDSDRNEDNAPAEDGEEFSSVSRLLSNRSGFEDRSTLSSTSTIPRADRLCTNAGGPRVSVDAFYSRRCESAQARCELVGSTRGKSDTREEQDWSKAEVKDSEHQNTDDEMLMVNNFAVAGDSLRSDLSAVPRYFDQRALNAAAETLRARSFPMPGPREGSIPRGVISTEPRSSEWFPGTVDEEAIPSSSYTTSSGTMGT